MMHSVSLGRRRLQHQGRLFQISVRRRLGDEVVLLGVRRRLWSSSQTAPRGDTTNRLRPSRFGQWGWVALGLSVWGAARSIQVVELGQLGVVEGPGSIREELLEPGLHWIAPWSTVTKYRLQSRQVVVPSQTRSRGGVLFDLELVVVYRLDPTKIRQIYLAHGKTDPQEWHVESVARSVLHSVVARKTWDQMHDTQQLAICGEIQANLNQIYGNQGILVERVVFQKVKLPDYFIAAIQEVHQLNLDINLDKLIIVGQLNAAKLTGEARLTVLNEAHANQKNATSKTLPAILEEGTQKTPLAELILSQASKIEKPNLSNDAKVGPEERKEKGIIETLFPFFFGEDPNKEEKKLPSLKAYVKQLKEDRKLLNSVSQFLSSKQEKESKGSDSLPPPKNVEPTQSADSDKLQASTLPKRKRLGDNPELEHDPALRNETESTLQETAADKAKAAAKTEKE